MEHEVITLKTLFDLPVGTRFRFDFDRGQIVYEVADDFQERIGVLRCDQCAFCSYCMYDCPLADTPFGIDLLCRKCERKDGRDVYFKRVERCGEEWTR